MPDRVFYSAFEYDFNDGHGEITVSRQIAGEDQLVPGKQILLVSIEGNRRSTTPLDYDGFGTIAVITDVRPAHNPDYVRVQTDLIRRKDPTDV